MSPNFNFSAFNVTELLLKNGVEIEFQRTLENENTRIRLIWSSMHWKLNVLHVKKNCTKMWEFHKSKFFIHFFPFFMGGNNWTVDVLQPKKILLKFILTVSAKCKFSAWRSTTYKPMTAKTFFAPTLFCFNFFVLFSLYLYNFHDVHAQFAFLLKIVLCSLNVVTVCSSN